LKVVRSVFGVSCIVNISDVICEKVAY